MFCRVLFQLVCCPPSMAAQPQRAKNRFANSPRKAPGALPDPIPAPSEMLELNMDSWWVGSVGWLGVLRTHRSAGSRSLPASSHRFGVVPPTAGQKASSSPPALRSTSIPPSGGGADVMHVQALCEPIEGEGCADPGSRRSRPGSGFLHPSGSSWTEWRRPDAQVNWPRAVNTIRRPSGGNSTRKVDLVP